MLQLNRPRLKATNYKASIEYRDAISKSLIDYSSYADNPVGFAYEVLGVNYLTDDQKNILESIRHNKVSNIQACHGIGKSHLMGAVLVPYWVFAMKGLCITTAPTFRQVKQVLWSEVRRSHSYIKNKIGGICGEMFLKLTEDSRAFGFTSRDGNSFQGIHADHLLLIEDEACGISQEIDESAEACIVGRNNRIVRVGNPTADGTPFAKACKRSHIRIPAWTHPNVAWAYRQDADGIHRIKEELRHCLLDKDGHILDRDKWGEPAVTAMQTYLESIKAIEIKGAISVEWIENVRDKHGESSAYWESRVEARFPLDAGQSIIPRRYFLMARVKFDNLTTEEWNKKLISQPSRYGLDVGDGGDPHALSRWQGSVLWSVRSQATLGDEKDAHRAAAMVVKESKTFGNGSVAVDNVGVGAGALSILHEEGYPSQGFRWGSTSTVKDKERFANLKAEQFWTLREAMEKGEIAIAPLGDYEDELMEDFASTYYEETVTGKVRIEEKPKTRARLGRSPDLGDAAVYGYHARSGGSRKPLVSVSPRR
jgi:hypothetical protein